MKPMAAALLALALLFSAGAPAQASSFVLDGEDGSELYAWNGAKLTPSGAYLSIYTVTGDLSEPEDALFAARPADGAAREGGDYALLDAKGNRLTDFLYDSFEYDPATGALIVMRGGLTGILDRSLAQLAPCAYDWVSFSGEGGFLMVPHSDLDAPPVLYMRAGEAPEKTGANARFYWSSLTEGRLVATGQSGLTGYLDSRGRWAVEPRFEWAQNFSNGYAIARENGLAGVIDRAGKWTVEPVFDDGYDILSDGSAAVMFRGSQVYFVRPSDGRQLFSMRLSEDGYVSIGSEKPLVAITDKGKSALLDARGKTLISVDSAYSFDLWRRLPEDRLLLSSSDRSLLMDLDGLTIYEAQDLAPMDGEGDRIVYRAGRYKTRTMRYEDQEPYQQPIYETARYGLVDSDGRELLPMIYRQLYSLTGGRYYAEDAQRRGVIDEAGEWIVSRPLYDQLMD